MLALCLGHARHLQVDKQAINTLRSSGQIIATRQPVIRARLQQRYAATMPLVAIELFDVVAAGAIAACAWGLLQWISGKLSRTPKLLWQRDEFNTAVLSRCPGLRSHYRVPALLANRHVETIFAAFFRQVTTHGRATACVNCTGAYLLKCWFQHTLWS